jgi:nucleoside-diphosphate-sugar epimerase
MLPDWLCRAPRGRLLGDAPAWDNNPVPLTEEAVLRPDTEFRYATQLAAVEQMADDWRRAAPGRTVAVLRPVVPMAANGTSGLARALAAGMGQRFAVDDPPAQFLHLDDLVDGRLAAASRPSGVQRRLTVHPLLLGRPVPTPPKSAVTSVRWRFQRAYPARPAQLHTRRGSWPTTG